MKKIYIFTTLLTLTSMMLAMDIEQPTTLTSLQDEMLLEILKHLMEQTSFSDACKALTLNRVNKRMQILFKKQNNQNKIHNILISKDPELQAMFNKEVTPQEATAALFEIVNKKKWFSFEHQKKSFETKIEQSPKEILSFAVKLLLGKGANINATVVRGEITYTPLLYAVTDYSPASSVFLVHGANPNAVNHLNQTSLMIARLQGRSDLVKSLLKYGANLDAKDIKGKTVLDKEYECFPWSIGLSVMEQIIADAKKK